MRCQRWMILCLTHRGNFVAWRCRVGMRLVAGLLVQQGQCVIQVRDDASNYTAVTNAVRRQWPFVLYAGVCEFGWNGCGMARSISRIVSRATYSVRPRCGRTARAVCRVAPRHSSPHRGALSRFFEKLSAFSWHCCRRCVTRITDPDSGQGGATGAARAMPSSMCAEQRSLSTDEHAFRHSQHSNTTYERR
ncbi:hypothetical protein OI25_828 [Paraburkholderia fungorum]|uniref:Secreted protein n=1 Tax=Paraburkholderia fungorum TaxID=134537 RepID=A0AAU8T2Q0_9BURK|nr:hypothetical protein OI25_828 [Paraburkholderia fungorum]